MAYFLFPACRQAGLSAKFYDGLLYNKTTSAYLMADVGQRVVRDLRNLLFRHMLDQSASFFSTLKRAFTLGSRSLSISVTLSRR